MKERPYVEVFLEIIELNGQASWRRLTFDGTDHADAVSRAVELMKRNEIRSIQSYDGPPRRWDSRVEVREL